MEASVIEAFSPEIRKEIFAQLGVSDLRDLGGFENFVFASENCVVRISHESHRTRAELLAELTFVDALAAAGAPVARPIPALKSDTILTVDDFHTCIFQMARGYAIRGKPYTEAVVRNWGRAIAQFHSVAQQGLKGLARSSWEDDANHDFKARIPADQIRVLAMADEMMSRLAELPTESAVYGLIHSDAHPGNFFVDDDDHVTVFDFDDCLYAWYGYDVATVLFGVLLEPWVATDALSQAQAVSHFLPPFLAGYAECAPLDGLLLEEMPLFLKLREFSLYAVIHAHDMGTSHDEMVSRFLENRKEKLEQDVPYVDFDFSGSLS